MPMEAAMPCKKKTTSLTCLQETVARLGAPNKVPQTKYACIGGSHEPTRQRMEPTLLKCHEDHIAGKEFHSMNHYDLVQQFMKAVKIPDAKTAAEKEWKKLETIQAWQQDEVRSKRGNSGSTKRQKQSPLCHTDGLVSPQEYEELEQKLQKYKGVLCGDTVTDFGAHASLMDICHLKNTELEPKLQKYRGRVVLCADFVKDDQGAYAVFTEQGSSASQVTAARVMDVNCETTRL